MRLLPAGISVAFGTMVLAGCGSSFNGAVNEGPGGGPQPASGEPVVTGVSPATVVAGGPSFSITVTGKNFAQGDTVEWDNFALTSTFVSSSQMTAQVPNQLIYESGTATIIVQPQSPYSLTFGATFTITAAPAPGTAGFSLSTVSAEANDMVWDPASQQIYLSMAGTDPSHPNTITALNPATGQFGTSISSATGAQRLAVSSDSSWLYAGIDKGGTVQRYALPGLASDISISLGAASSGQPYYAAALAGAPGSPNTIAVSQAFSSNQPGSVVLYDGSTARSSTVSSLGGYPGSIHSLAWNATGSDLYAAFNQIYQDDVYVLSVNSTGVQLAQSDQLNTSSESVTLGGIHYSALTGYLYGDDGAVIDPSGGKVVNQLAMGASGWISAYFTPLVTLDDNLGMAWVLAQPASGQSGQYVIETFDLKTNALLGSIAISNVTDPPVKLIRWGTNGLAFLTNGTGAGGIYVISGSFVTTPSVQ
jgi:hypothetical protein